MAGLRPGKGVPSRRAGPGQEGDVREHPRQRRAGHRVPNGDEQAISLDEASRQLELAVHDAQVAFDCIALGNLDRAHTNAVTARAAVDAAETLLRAVLGRIPEPPEGPVAESD